MGLFPPAVIQIISTSNHAVSRGTLIDCANVTKANQAVPSLELTRKTLTDHLGHTWPISVISENDLAKLKGLYPADLRVYDDQVCAARTHVLGEALARAGIETVKLYLKPGGNWLNKAFIIPDELARNGKGQTPHWDYHVANLIYVQGKDGSVREYVIDPFMESLPVPRDKWEHRLRSNPKSSIASEEVISRFNYGPGDADKPMEEYDPKVLETSKLIMSGSLKPQDF